MGIRREPRATISLVCHLPPRTRRHSRPQIQRRLPSFGRTAGRAIAPPTDNPFGAAPQQPLSFGTLREHFRATRDQEAAQPFARSSPEEAPAPDTPPAPPPRFGARAPGSAWLLDSIPPPAPNDDWLLEAPTVPHASAAPSYMASEPGEPFAAHPRQSGYADAAQGYAQEHAQDYAQDYAAGAPRVGDWSAGMPGGDMAGDDDGYYAGEAALHAQAPYDQYHGYNGSARCLRSIPACLPQTRRSPRARHSPL